MPTVSPGAGIFVKIYTNQGLVGLGLATQSSKEVSTVDLKLAEQIEGLPKAWSPMPFKKTPQTPSFGTPAESDDITGGIGY